MKKKITHPPVKRWLTIEDVACEYGFKNNTQKRMRHLKLIPYSRVGKNVRYDRVELNQWLEDNKVV
jgi:hypothetical protein